MEAPREIIYNSTSCAADDNRYQKVLAMKGEAR